jgi:hypothetical protein
MGRFQSIPFGYSCTSDSDPQASQGGIVGGFNGSFCPVSWFLSGKSGYPVPQTQPPFRAFHGSALPWFGRLSLRAKSRRIYPRVFAGIRIVRFSRYLPLVAMWIRVSAFSTRFVGVPFSRYVRSARLGRCFFSFLASPLSGYTPDPVQARFSSCRSLSVDFRHRSRPARFQTGRIRWARFRVRAQDPFGGITRSRETPIVRLRPTCRSWASRISSPTRLGAGRDARGRFAPVPRWFRW